jgi:hypothetical protein
VKRLNVSETPESKNKHNFNLWRFDERSTTIRWPKAHHQKMVHWQGPWNWEAEIYMHDPVDTISLYSICT